MEWDKLASKGAKLFSIIKYEQEFYFINTHMQADYKIDYSDIRISQYTEINNNLILPNEKSKAPLILCGDLNIAHPEKLNIMLGKLKLRNGPLFGNLQHSTLGSNKYLLDYILMRAEDYNIYMVKRRIIDFPSTINEGEANLSDHYPIEAVFSW
jgi:endonuclease/exonuclease/phosphatase family metal-dependent hydrolase